MKYRSFNKKHITVLLSICILSMSLLSGCVYKNNALPVYTEEVHVTIPGMTDSVKIAFLSDLHIAIQSKDVADTQVEAVNGRASWSSYDGISASEQWPHWVDTLNQTGADYCLLGGDMVDFASEANINALRDDLNRLEVPYMYIRADHDLIPYYQVTEVTYDIGIEYQQNLCEMDDVMIREFDDFCIVGWNNSTGQLSVHGLEIIKEACSLDKPLILLTHVPIKPLDDDSLASASKEVYQDRDLSWSYSNETYYYPKESPDGDATKELLNLIYSEDSPFIEVLAGHLHLSWDGNVTERVHEHVFSAAFNRYMGIITVSGE